MIEIPQINKDGTEKVVLLGKYVQPIMDLERAEKSLRDSAPEYWDYPSEDGSHARYISALVQHDERIKRLRAIYHEIAGIYRGIDEQPYVRKG